jgi:hypothetical protein
VHQVGPKNSGSQNFSFLAVEGAELAATQISTTATARDGRKFFYGSNYVIYSLFIPYVASKKVKNLSKFVWVEA